MADGQIRPSIATRGIQLQLIAGKGRFGQCPAHSLATCSCWKIATKSTPVANKDPYFRVDPAFRGETHQKAREGVARNKGVSYSKRYELLCRRLVLARIIHECRREAAETEARRGFSQVRATQAYLRSVEEAEREKPRRARGSAAVVGIHE